MTLGQLLDYESVGLMLDDALRHINVAASLGRNAGRIEDLSATHIRLVNELAEAQLADAPLEAIEQEARMLVSQARQLARPSVLPVILITAGALGAVSLGAYWLLFRGLKRRRRR